MSIGFWKVFYKNKKALRIFLKLTNSTLNSYTSRLMPIEHSSIFLALAGPSMLLPGKS